MTDSPKQIPPFGLRLPAELKARVQEAAMDANQSMNALIVTVLEEAFPHPTIDLHKMAEFLHGAVAPDGDAEGYWRATNAELATAKRPWTMRVRDGAVIFTPGADPEVADLVQAGGDAALALAYESMRKGKD